MTNRNIRRVKFIMPLALVAGLLAVSGCSQNAPAKATASTDAKGGATSGTIGASGAPTATEIEGQKGSSNFNYLPGNESSSSFNDSDITPKGLNDPNNLLSQRIIYFDYNQSTIRPEYMVLLNTHAKLLAKNPDLRVRLEGHADERGSREYNVALSEERARSVKRLMGTQGAQGFQMTTLGYGEELPLASGHSQDSWQKNRRVEIKYKHY